MTHPLQGVLPIVQTPFDDADEIDAATLRREIDYGFAAGIDGCGTGMVSELLRLSADERSELTRLIVEAAADRGIVFAGVGAESTRQAVALAKDAERLGCGAVMAPPPSTVRASAAALVDHFRALAEAVAVPVIVQDASGYVGQSIPLSVYSELLQRFGPEKIVFKPEAQPIGPNLSALREATGGTARIFEGSGGIHLVDSFRRGLAGTMPGMETIDSLVACWKALQRGDDEAAYRLYLPVCALVAIQIQAGLDGFLAVEKYILRQRAIFPNERRRGPLGWVLDRETATEVDRLFALCQRSLEHRPDDLGPRGGRAMGTP